MFNKSWYKSKTVWASIVGFGCTMAAVFGVQISTEEQVGIVEGLASVGALAALIMTIIGRKNAEGPLK